MKDELAAIRKEFACLQGGSPGEGPAETFRIECDTDARQVIERVKEVLLAYDAAILGQQPTDSSEISRCLPEWFRDKAAPEKTEEQSAEHLLWWNRPSNKEREAYALLPRPWSLTAWLYQMDPERRQWFWLDASVDPMRPTAAMIEIAADDWPYAIGALKWLLRSAGAVEISSDDDTD